MTNCRASSSRFSTSCSSSNRCRSCTLRTMPAVKSASCPGSSTLSNAVAKPVSSCSCSSANCCSCFCNSRNSDFARSLCDGISTTCLTRTTRCGRSRTTLTRRARTHPLGHRRHAAVRQLERLDDARHHSRFAQVRRCLDLLLGLLLQGEEQVAVVRLGLGDDLARCRRVQQQPASSGSGMAPPCRADRRTSCPAAASCTTTELVAASLSPDSTTRDGPSISSSGRPSGRSSGRSSGGSSRSVGLASCMTTL